MTTSMSSSQVRVIDPVLSTVAQGYKHPEYVGGRLFPRVPVNISGGQILEFGKESFKAYSLRRAPGGATARISFGYAGKPFALVQDSLEVPVPREHMRDASVSPGIDLGTRATNMGMKTISLALEVEQAGLAADAANYGANNKVTLAGTDKWSDAAGLPSSDIEAGRNAIRATTGQYPNVAILSASAYEVCKVNPSIVERFKYTSTDSITPAMLAALWDIPEVLVGKAISADDAGDFSDVWGNNAVLAYVPPNPAGMEEPSFAYTYAMEGHPAVELPYWDANAKSWIYGVTMERAAVIAAAGAGYLIQAPK